MRGSSQRNDFKLLTAGKLPTRHFSRVVIDFIATIITVVRTTRTEAPVFQGTLARRLRIRMGNHRVQTGSLSRHGEQRNGHCDFFQPSGIPQVGLGCLVLELGKILHDIRLEGYQQLAVLLLVHQRSEGDDGLQPQRKAVVWLDQLSQVGYGTRRAQHLLAFVRSNGQGRHQIGTHRLDHARIGTFEVQQFVEGVHKVWGVQTLLFAWHASDAEVEKSGHNVSQQAVVLCGSQTEFVCRSNQRTNQLVRCTTVIKHPLDSAVGRRGHNHLQGKNGRDCRLSSFAQGQQGGYQLRVIRQGIPVRVCVASFHAVLKDLTPFKTLIQRPAGQKGRHV
eukprot:m.104094 g.104094  ORF g.104094 m.104094 type:complete len:334 (-) comp10509_c0_seq2:226-1227(-)